MSIVVQRKVQALPDDYQGGPVERESPIVVSHLEASRSATHLDWPPHRRPVCALFCHVSDEISDTPCAQYGYFNLLVPIGHIIVGRGVGRGDPPKRMLQLYFQLRTMLKQLLISVISLCPSQ